MESIALAISQQTSLTILYEAIVAAGIADADPDNQPLTVGKSLAAAEVLACSYVGWNMTGLSTLNVKLEPSRLSRLPL